MFNQHDRYMDWLRLTRRFVRAALGRDVAHRTDVRLPTMKLGNEHADWVIYPDILTPDSVVYSFGVGEDVSFDLSLIEELGVTVHAFDPTPKSIRWVESRAFPSAFRFHRVGIAHFDGVAEFNAPSHPEHASYTLIEGEGDRTEVVQAEVRRLSTIMQELGHSCVDLLKLDVEGAEYEVVDDILNTGLDVGQILIEFHHRFAVVGIGRTDAAVARLRAGGYVLFSISARGEEFSFVRKDLI